MIYLMLMLIGIQIWILSLLKKQQQHITVSLHAREHYSDDIKQKLTNMAVDIAWLQSSYRKIYEQLKESNDKNT